MTPALNWVNPRRKKGKGEEEEPFWFTSPLRSAAASPTHEEKKGPMHEEEQFKNGKFIFLVLYVDDILLASSDVSVLLVTKKFLSSNFDIKDLGEASFVLGIEIHQDRSKEVLGLSQKTYIERILKKFSMHKCSSSPAPIVKGDRYGDFQCPRNQYEIDQIENGSICFSCRKLAMCSSMYAP